MQVSCAPASDQYGALSSVETITVTVAGQNDAPAGVTDLDGDVSSFVSCDTSGSIGTVPDNGDGALTYAPTAGFEALNNGEIGNDSFASVNGNQTLTKGAGGWSMLAQRPRWPS